MAVADPCGLGEAVQASRAVRVGGLWVWDHFTAGPTAVHVPRNDGTTNVRFGGFCYGVRASWQTPFRPTCRRNALAPRSGEPVAGDAPGSQIVCWAHR